MAIEARTTGEDVHQQVVDELKGAVREALATLTAWVDRFGKKWAGVKAVADEIEVRLPAGDERTDLDTAAAAAHAQSWVERPEAEGVARPRSGTTSPHGPDPDRRTMRGHCEPTRNAAKHRTAAILLAVVTATAGACGEDKGPKTANINETGIDTIAGDLRILAVHVPAPNGHRYPRGSNLRVILTIVNDGTTTDTLTRAFVPDAERTAIRWDRNCDGTLETLDRLPLAPAGGTATAEPAAAHPFDPYDVVAFSVRHDVLAGTSIDLTLTFQHAGRVVAAAYVQPKSADIVEPVRRCDAGSPRTSDR